MTLWELCKDIGDPVNVIKAARNLGIISSKKDLDKQLSDDDVNRIIDHMF